MKQPSSNETTPGDLLANFNGRSLKSIIIFTIFAHAVLLLATSGSFLWNKVAGADSSKLSESERVDLAYKETTVAMRRIAEQHGIKPQDLGSRFTAPTAAAKPKSDAPPADPKADAAPKTAPVSVQPPAPEKPESTIEKELKKAEPGPTVPGAGDEDLFK